MQTYSHLLMTAVAGDLARRAGHPVDRRALLLGSVLPDLPLYVLGAGYIGWAFWLGPALTGQPPPDEHVFGRTFDALYFTNPVWITAHHLLHAPLLIALYAALGAWGRRAGRVWGAALWWFALGCAFHAGVDVLTHYDDGPLVFFPFNWTYRFQAPVSYWDPAQGGWWFGPLEAALDLALLAYLAWRRWGKARG